ncbi:DNA polymerase subunit gamma-2, mitochondrial [Plutella xylostella]|uniref:DNA polymerase subunit gamma-2, mitochondrial n=1 Tax=Plutella xylostella TaxID=51655 RepID=UPI0020321FC7|nr:DNA polymerase subunit gamma-2, mitochondrial [Plutella xylostella]
MKTELLKILSLKTFFRILETNGNTIKYSFQKPSLLLLHNIHVQWLQYIWQKTDKHVPVYLSHNGTEPLCKNEVPSGFIDNLAVHYNDTSIIQHNIHNFEPQNVTKLRFNLKVSEQEVMPYFFQWQRYRKYWWSSITTTPGLFSINEIRNGDDSAEVDIVAHLTWGEQVVENVSFKKINDDPATSTLTCSTSLEAALITLLADGLINSSKEDYLRLHRKLAPYKVSFALQCDDDKTKKTLQDLAILLNSKLQGKNISTWFPEFKLPVDEQLTVNRKMGVVYTAILDDAALNNGIFYLMNSSTMLKEQIHVSDFENYAELLFKN